MRRPIRPLVAQSQPDLPVGAQVQPVLGERRPQCVPAESLQPIALAGSRHQTRVEIKTTDVRVAGPQHHRCHVLRRVAATAHARPRPRTERHAPFHGCRRHGREDRRLLRLQIRRPAALGTPRETAALEQLLDAARDEGHDGRHVLAREPPHGMKVDPASVRSEHAIQHERVEVDVEIEGAAEALNDRHGAALAVGDAVTSCATPQEPEHCAQRNPGHGPTQLVIPGEQVSAADAAG